MLLCRVRVDAAECWDVRPLELSKRSLRPMSVGSLTTVVALLFLVNSSGARSAHVSLDVAEPTPGCFVCRVVVSAGLDGPFSYIES